jgi:signal transduction histidine kinase
VRLIPRFVVGTLAIVGVLGAVVILAGDARERRAVRDGESSRLQREAELIASWWQRQPGMAGGVAEAAARTLGLHVVLIGRDGVRVADSDARTNAPIDAERFGNRPEVAAALSGTRGVAERGDTPDGRTHLYVAMPSAGGVVRVDRPLDEIAGPVRATRDDLVITAVIALVLAGLFAWYIGAGVAMPVAGLRDTARALAGGDLARRPALSAPGEVGELANALHRLAEALSTRVEAHAAEDALVNATLEALHEGVVAVDARANVVRINETARRLLGARDDLPFASDLLPRDRALREAMSAALAGVPTDPVETTLGDRTLALAARPLAQGGAVLAVLDLTAQRRLETIRRDFVANVSHELKTPLTVVSGFADTLLDPDLPTPIRLQFAETIRAHAQRMQRIVDDLLDLSRIESGGWIPNPSDLDLSALAPDATAVAAEKADRQGVTLDIAIAPGAAHIWSDATAMRQILSNLADNAVRHTAAGRVTVFAEPLDGGIVVGVRDTGSGIPAEHLDRIFERFYRVDPGRSREQGGTGLGLAIVRHLVESHGGRVSADSIVGHGTTISCWFPLPASRPA